MEKHFGIASDLGVRDSNRIAHRGGIARFGPLCSQGKTAIFRRLLLKVDLLICQILLCFGDI